MDYKVSFVWTVLVFAIMLSTSLYCLAYQLIYNRNGKVAKCFRISLSTTSCTVLVLSHLYNGRWGMIPDVVVAAEDDDEDPPYSEAELSRMKPRPNLERVIEEEHQRSLRIAQTNTAKPANKNHFPTRSRSGNMV